MKIRKPRIKLTSKGLKVTKPSARIGKRVGVNVSSKGAKFSVHKKRGILSGLPRTSTRKKGCGCPLPIIMVLVMGLAISRLTRSHNHLFRGNF